MRKLPIVKEAFLYILVLLLVTLGLYMVYKPLSVLGLILLVFVIYFFRNPHRNIPAGDNIIVSPADGRVMSVTEIDEPDFIGARAKKITIFLSIFNVHINRSPVTGVVKYTSYRPGKYLPAFKSHASELNERNTIGIEGNIIRVLVHQITGLIARRIVCWVKDGDNLKIGERFGLIKFGSCTEIVVPLNVDIKVKQGDKVRGAKTIIGVIC
jgi:phosphatidylserine decarboxylase